MHCVQLIWACTLLYNLTLYFIKFAFIVSIPAADLRMKIVKGCEGVLYGKLQGRLWALGSPLALDFAGHCGDAFLRLHLCPYLRLLVDELLLVSF